MNTRWKTLNQSEQLVTACQICIGDEFMIVASAWRVDNSTGNNVVKPKIMNMIVVMIWRQWPPRFF